MNDVIPKRKSSKLGMKSASSRPRVKFSTVLARMPKVSIFANIPQIELHQKQHAAECRSRLSKSEHHEHQPAEDQTRLEPKRVADRTPQIGKPERLHSERCRIGVGSTFRSLGSFNGRPLCADFAGAWFIGREAVDPSWWEAGARRSYSAICETLNQGKFFAAGAGVEKRNQCWNLCGRYPGRLPLRTMSSGCSDPSAIQSGSSASEASYTVPRTSTCQMSV